MSEERMKVTYDNEVDALYIRLSDDRPKGVSEISDGVNLDITSSGKLVGIEILDASKRMDPSPKLSSASG